ncbi:RNA polymerase sigma factor [Desulfosporosinus sp. BICA1-9]|uniref:RNA polymerase sigma factor n=1 Tax=Desulfosporosinus sp. BICA1-9 TaxID=1531958 RepID=UPI000A408B44|nr:sigma-70 family RNA polymerase sigma factor [Desulfosporosinus sp. BICA1-9]HBW34615.1 sigma-70 family RNA polymerase sigma factor [Desulfosporosinus sp.]
MSSKDLEIFKILAKQTYERVYQTVYFYTKDKYISEDAVQQAFVIAYNKLNQLEFKDKFASWVISIALNEAKRMLNNKNNDKITLLTDLHLGMLSDSSLENDIELKEDINNVLKKLNKKEHEILVLKYYADLSLHQIAMLLDINLSNAKVRLHRAKEKFRNLIDKDLNQNLGG